MSDYEMALSEIEMYKKAHESLSENLTHANKKVQQFKEERDTLNSKLNQSYEDNYKLEGQLHDMTKRHGKLIYDIAVLKTNISRLEREKKEREKRAEEAMTLAEEANCQVVSLQELLEINESSTKDLILKLQNSDTQKIEDENKELNRLAESRKGTIKGLKRHVKDLRLQSNTYFDEWQEAEKQRSEFNLYVNLYATLTNHIRQKAEANPGVSRYIDLVNYIDRLERADDEI